MNIKIFFGITAVVVGLISYYPYTKDLFSGKTKPHIYSWLIWTITQGTAMVAIFYGGGVWGGLELLMGTIFNVAILVFCLRYGTKNITKSDTVVLIIALLAILAWWQLKMPLISVLLVTAIDFFGFIPSFRKSYQEPWSETLSSWVLFSVANIFSILALNQYNLLTTIYLIFITVANMGVFFICLCRRSFVQRPN
jgi:hypothetical protein